MSGASTGAGLGNAFLSHVRSVDGIFQVVRAFDDDEVTHVEGDVNPIRDMEIIQTELRLKDIEWVQKQLESNKRTGRSLGNSSLVDKARKAEIVSGRCQATSPSVRVYHTPRQRQRRCSDCCQKKTRTSEKWNGRTRRWVIFHVSMITLSSSWVPDLHADRCRQFPPAPHCKACHISCEPHRKGLHSEKEQMVCPPPPKSP